jgi:hypothetical protein
VPATVFVLLFAAQISNPAYEAIQGPKTSTSASQRGSWRMPGVVVVGKSTLREEELIGPAAQPRWTAKRRFGETRVYVIPEGQLQFEYWLISETPRHENTDVTMQYEIEMGLPERFQLDIYALAHKQLGTNGPLAFDTAKLELRWAFANWGALPLNPTLYLEYTAIGGAADHLEGKLLLGDQLAPRWHYGINLVLEHTLGDRYDNSYELTGGISYTVTDERIALGIEGQIALVDQGGHRGSFVHQDYLLGPSVQFRPLPQMHIDLVLLAGLTKGSLAAKGFGIVGWEI